MQEGPILGFLKLVIQVCGQPLAFKKKKNLAVILSGERPCSLMKLGSVFAPGWNYI